MSDSPPYEHISVRPLCPTIGAEIGDIDLRKPVDSQTYDELRRSLLDWKVIFFRDQDISTEEHIAFARNFGELEVHPFGKNKPGYDEVLTLENGPESRSTINVWHSDVTWRQEPSHASILRAVEVPEVGGDTLWADMCAAYDGLPNEFKEQIDDLVGIHDFMAAFGGRLTDEQRAQMREKYPIAEHPVVRTHPETGRKGLYVNAAFTKGIVGMEEKEARRTLRALFLRASVPEYQVRFHWEKNSIAFWDNRACQHYPASDYFPAVRRMERVTVIGDRPV